MQVCKKRADQPTPGQRPSQEQRDAQCFPKSSQVESSKNP